jgi:hypothetical protein
MDMSATAAVDRAGKADSIAIERPAGLVLLRVAAGAADAGTVARDTWRLLSPTTSADHWAHETDALLDRFVTDALVECGPGKTYRLTSSGLDQARRFVGAKSEKAFVGGWPVVRDGILLLRALGLEATAGKRQKAIAKIDALRLAIVVSAWGLKLKGNPTPARVRTALALLALERAFGNSVKGALGAKTDLSPKASRLLAAQLSKAPKDYGTDARLVAALASDAVGAGKSDLASLRQGAIRRFIVGQAAPGIAPKAERRRKAVVPPSEIEPNARGELQVAAHPILPAPSVPSATVPEQLVAPLPSRPDLAGFAAAVNAAAAVRAEGWSGNRKAFVSAVWEIIRERHGAWQISEIEFKSMLTEAHRTGLIVLANADLKDKRYMAEIQASAIPYKNTVWHYIRVEG